MTKRIAIIPARGGSKRVPDKNIRDFCGNPMISYPLRAAAESGLFDVVHVSTDSARITRMVNEIGFNVDFPRPDELADDVTGIMPVLKYVLEEYRTRGQEFDQVCLLMATAALIDSDDLKGAAALHDKVDSDKSVLGVVPYSVPIEWAFELNSDNSLTPVQPGMFATSSQELSEKYHDAGVFTFFSASRVLESEGDGKDNDIYAYPLPKYKAVDIDDADDWRIAEAMFRMIDLSGS
ncbi:pseudaminic acid cytidylyltransferase [Pseudomonadota bacterium]